MSEEINLYDCPVCHRDPWNCTCLSKERARRIAYVIGYPSPTKTPTDEIQELVPATVPGG